jgi:hypothetical protein
VSQAVFSQAQTQALMDDANLNPTSNQTDAEVHVTLVFRGVTANPATIYDAVQTLGAVVRTDMVPARNNYSFIISAS